VNTKIVLLNISEKDLVAARCLFKEKLYPQAIFYLQQAVEKATKAMGLHHKIITENELVGIGHNVVKVYTRMLEDLKPKVIRTQDRIRQFPKLEHTTLFRKFEEIDPEKFEEILTNFESFLRYSNQQLTDEGLEYAFLELTKLEEELNSQKITIEEDINKFKSLAYEVVKAIGEEDPIAYEIIEKKFDSLTPQLTKKLIEYAISVALCHNCLLFLSIRICPLASPARYPYPEHGHDPLQVYIEQHPLIKRFEQLAQIVEKALNSLREVFSRATEIEKEINMSK
jgi:tetratricopeptide (TPR) repeat protein